jgi:hypothetical protein
MVQGSLWWASGLLAISAWNWITVEDIVLTPVASWKVTLTLGGSTGRYD